MPPFTYQLYSSRNFGPVEAVLDRVAGMGYQRVEGYGGLFDGAVAVEGLAKALASHGLSMPTAHIGLDLIQSDPAFVTTSAQALGIETVVIPYLDDRPNDAAGWSALGAEVAKAAAPLRAEGLTVGWHNHDFEFEALDGADLPLALLLEADPQLRLELDLAWLHVAGQDPVKWVTRYADRLVAAHLKDVAPHGACADEGGWADLGEGVLEWPKIVAALNATGVRHLVMEHDNPKDDARFAKRSIAAAQHMAWRI